jgi:hypothetical protein
MNARGLLRDEQRLADLPVGASGGDEGEYLGWLAEAVATTRARLDPNEVAPPRPQPGERARTSSSTN